jgi:hypothetical protein
MGCLCKPDPLDNDFHRRGAGGSSMTSHLAREMAAHEGALGSCSSISLVSPGRRKLLPADGYVIESDHWVFGYDVQQMSLSEGDQDSVEWIEMVWRKVRRREDDIFRQ